VSSAEHESSEAFNVGCHCCLVHSHEREVNKMATLVLQTKQAPRGNFTGYGCRVIRLGKLFLCFFDCQMKEGLPRSTLIIGPASMPKICGLLIKAAYVSAGRLTRVVRKVDTMVRSHTSAIHTI